MRRRATTTKFFRISFSFFATSLSYSPYFFYLCDYLLTEAHTFTYTYIRTLIILTVSMKFNACNDNNSYGINVNRLWKKKKITERWERKKWLNAIFNCSELLSDVCSLSWPFLSLSLDHSLAFYFMLSLNRRSFVLFDK